MSNTTPERTAKEYADDLAGKLALNLKKGPPWMVELFAQAIEQGRQDGLAQGWDEGHTDGYKDAIDEHVEGFAVTHNVNPHRASTTTPKP